MFEERKDDFELGSTIDNFDLEDDFGVLESGDFDLFGDLEEGELIETGMDKEIELANFEKEELTEESNEKGKSKVKISKEEQAKEKEGDEKISQEESQKVDVIEPSTLVEQKLQEVEEISDEKVPAEEKKGSESAKAASGVETSEVSGEAEKESIEEEHKEEEEKIEKPEKEERGVLPVAETTISKEESMKKVLEKLLESSPDFEGAAVVSYDGFILTAALPEGADESRTGAMSAAILSLGERACGEMGKGKLETVFVEGEEGYVLVTAINDDALLTLVTSKYAKLGLVFYELRSVKEELKEVLSS